METQKEKVKGSPIMPSKSKQPKTVGIVLADVNQKITHVNPAFEILTGYSSHESIGRNCNFLQGKDTTNTSVQAIRECLSQGREFRGAILNYCKDGTAFWNLLTISPLMDKTGRITQYVGIQMSAQSMYVDRSLGAFPWTTVKSPFRGSYARSNRKLIGDVQEGKKPKPKQATSVVFVAETNLPTTKGVYRVRCFEDTRKNAKESEIICVCHGTPEGREDLVVRVHDQCFTSEVLGSLKCDCKEQLDFALEYIRTPANFAGGGAHGMVIYMPQEGRGIGLGNKIKAYSMQELGLDTVDANRILGFEDDTRDYSAVPAILDLMDIRSIRMITNNPRKVACLTDLGVKVTGCIEAKIQSNPHSHLYLDTKKSRMGHWL